MISAVVTSRIPIQNFPQPKPAGLMKGPTVTNPIYQISGLLRKSGYKYEKAMAVQMSFPEETDMFH